jgi:hypothetical protein
MENKILTTVVGTTILVISIVLALGTPHAYAQSHYQIGYDDGCAGRVVEGHRTSEYERGYADGQAACSRNGDTRNISHELPSNRGPSTSIGSSSVDWSGICNTVQILLVQSCDQLVNSDDSLTTSGQHAMECIRNGVFLAAGRQAISIPLPMAVKILTTIAPSFGCGNVVVFRGAGQLSI